ncbi:predicted protein [Nematostella vectensis]|uniref:Uncharacterized protein n=1 Tax=Nematostella vectensis TaxID=45351 RepID=A7RST2_NEMVE|nr:predicted protein [Nematostella vectensis]|eukprot:XP_001637531.1 predicted protein [Nematostella vectensis]
MPATIQTTPSQFNKETEHLQRIAWAPKKKKPFQRRISVLREDARIHSQCRKRLDFSSIEVEEEPTQEDGEDFEPLPGVQLTGFPSGASSNVTPNTPNLKPLQIGEVPAKSQELLFDAAPTKKAARNPRLPVKRKLTLSSFR